MLPEIWITMLLMLPIVLVAVWRFMRWMQNNSNKKLDELIVPFGFTGKKYQYFSREYEGVYQGLSMRVRPKGVLLYELNQYLWEDFQLIERREGRRSRHNYGPSTFEIKINISLHEKKWFVLKNDWKQNIETLRIDKKIAYALEQKIMGWGEGELTIEKKWGFQKISMENKILQSLEGYAKDLQAFDEIIKDPQFQSYLSVLLKPSDRIGASKIVAVKQDGLYFAGIGVVSAYEVLKEWLDALVKMVEYLKKQ